MDYSLISEVSLATKKIESFFFYIRNKSKNYNSKNILTVPRSGSKSSLEALLPNLAMDCAVDDVLAVTQSRSQVLILKKEGPLGKSLVGAGHVAPRFCTRFFLSNVHA